jgi:hypothetical protein
MYLLEFQNRANALQEKLKEYSEFIYKNALKPSIPAYEKEKAFAQGIEKYAVERVSSLEDGVRRLVQQINAKMAALEKKKIDGDKEKDFKLANDISKETEFHKYVVKLIDDAFLKIDRPKVGFEFLGSRLKGVKKFMTLASLCSPESLAQPQNDWFVWGCKRYEEYLPQAKKNLTILYTRKIKLGLTTMELDNPDLSTFSEIRSALAQNNLERAIDLYDQLLRDL